ncbi:hypothetical protein QBC39DRAFT_342684 [Podospora conica]|nr:hypothetical protein QBC39DRAFT_342684 [Schizothecium conicum]
MLVLCLVLCLVLPCARATHCVRTSELSYPIRDGGPYRTEQVPVLFPSQHGETWAEGWRVEGGSEVARRLSGWCLSWRMVLDVGLGMQGDCETAMQEGCRRGVVQCGKEVG